MKIELSINEAKYLCLKALNIEATLKSREGIHVLQTQVDIRIYGETDGTMEKGTRGC